MTFVKSTPPTAAQVFNWLQQVELFSGLSQTALAPLIARASLISLASGETIAREGMPLSGCALVISGELEVFRHTYLGEEKIFGIFHAYELVAIAAVFMPHERFPMTIRAKTDSAVLMLEKDSLLQVCESNPTIMKQLLTQFSLKLYETMNHIDWLTSSTAEQRLAVYFLAQRRQQKKNPFILPISRRQLATKLGVRYETLSRLLSKWRAQQVIENNGKQIKLLQKAYLDKLTLPARRLF